MKKLSKEEVLKRFKKVHGNRYDYSLVDYINLEKKVKIICREHGEFEQRVNAHIRGQGCYECGLKTLSRKNSKKIREVLVVDEATFIKEARRIHGDAYDYSLVVYKGSKSLVKIICKEHGIFLQRPANHISQKNGCPKCSRKPNRKELKEDFLKKAIAIHPQYDYSLVKYKNAFTNIKLICKKHGEFEISPTSLLSGRGCLQCGIEHRTLQNRLTNEEFIERSKSVHGDLFDYSLVEYEKSSSRIKIICKKHGEFETSAHSHLYSKTGCPLCSSSKGEREIYKLLKEKNIEFETEKIFEDCRDTFYLRFDFYLPKENLCIEFDGIQHFEPIDAFGGEEGFKDRIRKDKIKEEFLKENKINLLRISYLENIEEVLNENLQHL